MVDPATDHISDEDNPPEDPEPVSQTRVSESEGHEDGQENPKGWETDDITQEANHQGADRNEHENTESGLKVFGQAKQRPSVEPSI